MARQINACRTFLRRLGCEAFAFAKTFFLAEAVRPGFAVGRTIGGQRAQGPPRSKARSGQTRKSIDRVFRCLEVVLVGLANAVVEIVDRFFRVFEMVRNAV